MKLVFKNATFDIYGIPNISEFMSTIRTAYNVSDPAELLALENLFIALEVYKNDGIFSKLKFLLMPCVAASGTNTDGSCYDIVSKQNLWSTTSVSDVVEHKRGVRPVTFPTFAKVISLSTLNIDNLSAFGIMALSEVQAVSSSAGSFLSETEIGDLNWDSTNPNIVGKRITYTNSIANPISWTMSKVENGIRQRTVNSDAVDTQEVEASETTISSVKIMSRVWSCLGILAIADGLTIAECNIIKPALIKFISEFGVNNGYPE